MKIEPYPWMRKFQTHGLPGPRSTTLSIHIDAVDHRQSQDTHGLMNQPQIQVASLLCQVGSLINMFYGCSVIHLSSLIN